MTKKTSIAWRIRLVLTGLISLAVCVAALLTYCVYQYMENRMIRDLIQTESSRLVKRVSRFGGNWERPFERDMGPSMFAWGESRNVQAESLPDELRGLPVGLHDLDRGESTWHVAVADAMDGRLYVVYDTVVVERQLRDFSLALLGIVAGCSLLAVLISSTVARWLITPLNLLTERLTRWVPSSGMAEIRHVNEVDRLMEVFNRVQAQVDASIADQREFSANLHHEIRTPLTVIRSDAELMIRNKMTDPDVLRPKLERIIKAVHEISQSLEGTFSLAYARFEDKAPFNMHACVEDIFQNLHLEADKAGLLFVNEVRPDHEETLNHHALMIVMRNIIRNAVLHAAPATLVIESIPHGLRFTDSGPGIEPSELPNIFERYFSNRRSDQARDEGGAPASSSRANQTGLGLAIAKRVCIIQSWNLDVASPANAGKGTSFTLCFDQGAIARAQ
ncbi:HAMP domain-containing histidine kinase [Pseudothauera nasutitermitis]|uniref:histidine kinase n=1 Tax=Pseudothauera nasutitermitis TaxID=2565930 RepID=A0A4V3WCJ6_9RHOO|nr:HAMP domain-containing sensor histidine kinase [Pseudothauera nasutitermitis]THF67404.1 HAMP domain-containing histidine kinase [Pseudothauera nasutitermitis]